ncbi:MAG: YiiQ family protein, partial [Serratia symbiotica]|nr:YiiQ family protein [Serratia symbiotica]
PLLTRAASKLNENLYASTALEKGTGKIKTLQITYLPLQQSGEDKAALAIAISYLAALMRQFEPALTVGQSQGKVTSLLVKGKGSRFYQQQ